MKKESFSEKINDYFVTILGVVVLLSFIWLWNLGIMPFEDCVLLCIFSGIGSIINTILITGERIIKKINELNDKEK